MKTIDCGRIDCFVFGFDPYFPPCFAFSPVITKFHEHMFLLANKKHKHILDDAEIDQCGVKINQCWCWVLYFTNSDIFIQLDSGKDEGQF